MSLPKITARPGAAAMAGQSAKRFAHIDLVKELVNTLFPSTSFDASHAAVVDAIKAAEQPNDLRTLVAHVDEYLAQAILTTVVAVSGADVNTAPVQLLREITLECAKVRALVHAALMAKRGTRAKNK